MTESLGTIDLEVLFLAAQLATFKLLEGNSLPCHSKHPEFTCLVQLPCLEIDCPAALDVTVIFTMQQLPVEIGHMLLFTELYIAYQAVGISFTPLVIEFLVVCDTMHL